MPGPAAIVAGIGLALSLVDVGFSIFDEASPDPLQDDIDRLNGDVTRIKMKLDELDGKIDDLDDALADLGTALLDEFDISRVQAVNLSIAEAEALARGAKDKLFEYRALVDPTAAQRDAIIEDAEDALRDIVAKANAALSEPGAIAGFMGTLSYVVGIRMAVAAELEDGAIGKQSIRTALEDVSTALTTAKVQLLQKEADLAVHTITLISRGPAEGGRYQATYQSLVTSPSGPQTFETTHRLLFRDFDDYNENASTFVDAIRTNFGPSYKLILASEILAPYELGQIDDVVARLDALSDGTDAFAPTDFGAVVDGTNGNDLLRGKNGNDTLNGMDDHDVMRAEGGDDVMDGGGGNDLMFGGEGNDLGLGGEGDDGILGGAGRDTLKGGAGEDELSGGDDADFLQGDADNDLIDGGTGNDRAFGGAGDDTIRGGEDDDRLFGGFDNDLMEGGSGEDYLGGGYGDDLLRGDGGADTLRGDAGADTLAGGAQDDVLLGGAGSDALFGGWGDDDLKGGGGNDRLYGGTGNDTLAGGTGFDLLSGGGGADTFVFGSGLGRGQDRIADFTSGADRIELDAAIFGGLGTTGALDPDNLQFSATASGADAVLLYQGGVLSYDADGNGAGAAIGLARLIGAPSLDSGDIFLL